VTQLRCRSCAAPLSSVFVDLGLSPISNAFRQAAQAAEPETFFPLRAFVCDVCKLVQLQDFERRETHFNADYPYYSSFSSSWLDHSRRYADMAIDRFDLDGGSRVIEVGSNDGYLLRYFLGRGIPSIGVDPAVNCAEAARRNHGLETVVAFFGRDLAARIRESHGPADLMIGNNVLAHVPDINDFVAGFSTLLKPAGTATFEFPHLMELIARNEFDTIYHEHYSYLSLLSVFPLFTRHALNIVDVDQLPTHGHSLRLYVQPSASGGSRSKAVERLMAEEKAAGLDRLATYVGFGERVKSTKRALLELLIHEKREGRSIAGYGAPAKGSTLLNYCGIRTDFLDFTVDRNPAKQGRLMPGTGIPILAPDEIGKRRPDLVLILPWNLTDEIVGDLSYIRDWGGRFIVPIPEPLVLSVS
jgi:2-polyprenyl-3-methyl-5-hydroxy-6-metoxy-1,4-benzoquinol methylase